MSGPEMVLKFSVLVVRAFAHRTILRVPKMPLLIRSLGFSVLL